MAVIREDVVSIGFDVQNNPFAELTAGINDIKAKLGILDETTAGFGKVGEEAKAAARGVEALADGIHAPPGDGFAKPFQETRKETKKAEVTLTGLLGQMKQTAGVKLSGGVEKLSSAVKRPVTGFQDLTKKAAKLRGIKLDNPAHSLNVVLGKAAIGAGKLLVKMKDAAKVGFQKAISGLKSMAAQAGKVASSLGKGALKAAGKLTKGLAVGIGAGAAALTAGAAAAFKFGSAYETSLAKVSTIADTAKVSMESLSGDVLKLSNATGEGAAGLNEAVYQAISAGADTAGVVDLVGVAVKAAKGGYTDTTTAIDGLTSTLNAYGMATSDAEGLANQFLITQNKGKTTFGELAGSIGTVAPTAKAAGVGVDQLLAGVASLTANGIGTSEAMTGMKAALSNVIKPTAEASKMAADLGLEFNTAALQSKGLVGFLDDIKTATGGDTDKMAKLFGSVEALNTVLTLTSDQGSQLMNNTLEEMATNTSALDDAYQTMDSTTQSSVKKGLNSFKNLGIGIYQSSEGIVSDLTGLFSSAGQELYDAFESGGFEGLTGQIGATLSTMLTTVTGYLPDLVEGGISIVGSLIDGITANQDGIVDSLTRGLTGLGKGILKTAPKLLMAGHDILTSLTKGIADEMPQLVPLALEAIQTLSDGLLENVPQLVQSGISILNSLILGLLQAAPLIVSSGVQLIMSLVQGLLNSVDLIISGAVNLILALATGILANVPLLIQAAAQLVTGFVNGLVNNVGLIIDGAITLVQGIFTGLIGNIPAIIRGAIQIVFALAGGLIHGVPALLAATPRLIGAVINAIMSTDWLKLGLDVVKGIGSGLVKGIKGLFSKGKDAGKEVGEGVSAGLDESTQELMTSSETAAAAVTEGAQPDTVQLSDYGVQSAAAYKAGMDSGALDLYAAAGTISTETAGQFQAMDLSQIGYQNTLGLSQGLLDGSGMVMGTAQDLSAQAAAAAQTDVVVAIDTDAASLDSFVLQAQDSVSGADSAFGRLPDLCGSSMDTAGTVTVEKMAGLTGQMKTAFTGLVNLAREFAAAFQNTLEGLQLYETGVHIMKGLNQGMLNMRPVLLETARSAARGISLEINRSLDIHSPSKVTEKSGEYADLGLVKGMKNFSGKVGMAAREVGELTADSISPMNIRYSPETSGGAGQNRTSVQENHYAPQFHLTLNGASASDSNERKVKRWMKEVWRDCVEEMARANPRIQEV